MSNIRILLVEDNIADARLVQEVFQEEKIAPEVDVARYGRQSVAIFRRKAEKV